MMAKKDTFMHAIIIIIIRELPDVVDFPTPPFPEATAILPSFNSLTKTITPTHARHPKLDV
jgi:hypothetical protein